MLPRIWTRPLRELSPETSFGFDVVDFARHVLDRPFDPWQEWLVIHACELLEDGRPRFRVVHVQVARQNGKTEIPVLLSLYWQMVDSVPLILGTSTKIDYAKESWMKAVRLAEKAPGLRGLVPDKRRDWMRQANGEQESWLCGHDPQCAQGCSRYKIAAANEEGGRSLTIDRLILDELRQHHDYSAWDAAIPAGKAVPAFQVWALSNAGSERSVVLNNERAAALAYIDTDEGDYRTGWFEWSAPEGADPMDLDALAQANPNLGYRIDAETLLLEAKKAVQLGGASLAGFRTENMCQSVITDDPEIDPQVWEACADPNSQAVGPLAFAVEVALDNSSAAIAAAGRRSDGKIHTEIIDERQGSSWVTGRIRELVEKWSPAIVALDASSPAGALTVPIKTALVTVIPDQDKLDKLVHEMSARQMAASFAGLLQDIKEDKFRHLGQPTPAYALGAAVARDVGDGGRAWGRRRSGRDIAPLVALTSARWALIEVIPEPTPKVWGFFS